jgi:hypothetical protein
MGTTVTGYLSAEEAQHLADTRTAMGRLGRDEDISSRQFVFLATFDGTNNNKNDYSDDNKNKTPLSGSPYQTNVANIYDQADAASKSNASLQARYYPGVGTGGENGNLWDAAFSPTKAVHFAAEKALKEFAEQARDYLRDNKDANPPPTHTDLSASAVGFSRGSPTAIVFTQLLNERGLVLPDGTVVAPPGVKVIGLALIEPVATGISGDLSIPSNVQGSVLVVRALDELRADFKALDLSRDSRVQTYSIYGNHCGSGGGDDKNGISAAVLEGTTGYLQNVGVKVSNVLPENRFKQDEPPALRTEAYQNARNGDVLVNEDGSPKLTWRVEGERGARGTTLVTPPDSRHPEDRHSRDAVNGLDLNSDKYQPAADKEKESSLSQSAPAQAFQAGTLDYYADSFAQIDHLYNALMSDNPDHNYELAVEDLKNSKFGVDFSIEIKELVLANEKYEQQLAQQQAQQITMDSGPRMSGPSFG